MTTTEILNILYNMYASWKSAIDYDGEYYALECFKIKCYYGFCYWLENTIPTIGILPELEKDLKNENKIQTRTSYWYPTVGDTVGRAKGDIIPFALQPRLDHIQRTITRLENTLYR